MKIAEIYSNGKKKSVRFATRDILKRKLKNNVHNYTVREMLEIRIRDID